MLAALEMDPNNTKALIFAPFLKCGNTFRTMLITFRRNIGI